MQFEANVFWQLMSLEYTDITGVVTGAELTGYYSGFVEQYDYIDTAAGGRGVEQSGYFNIETGLFQHFSGCRFFRVFRCFDEAPGQAPVVHKWLETTLYQHYAAIHADQGGSHRFRIVPVNKITFIGNAGQPVFPSDIDEVQWTGTERAAFQGDLAIGERQQ